jgi:F-type H+-transporting ATPase subunit epsilon
LSTLRVSLVSPEKALYSGEAKFVVIPAFDDGEVGFLPGHAPYIGKLGYGTMRVTGAQGEPLRFAVFGGFVEVRDDVVTVLASRAATADQISEESLAADLEEVRALPSKTEEEYRTRRRRMREHRARVELHGRAR